MNGYSGADWRRWLPCVGMALCACLSFADRQLLVVLAPTILLQMGLTAQDFGNVTFCFFIAYTLGNPVWGSVIDRVGPRLGMLAAVGVWTAASASHAFTVSVVGFAIARAVLGFGEGATFPGALRTATESLPAHLRGRGMALAFTGGAVGGIVTPLVAIPLALRFGWQRVFLLSGLCGLLWLILWAVIARPPFLPAFERKEAKIAWPNLFERRFWALVSSYALPAVASGTNLTIVPIYLNRGLGVSQADFGRILWLPPLAWAVGSLFWGWIADRYVRNSARPVALFGVLTFLAIPLALTTTTTSVSLAMVLICLSVFTAAGFQMVALKVGTVTYPREQGALMSGIASGAWSLCNALLSPLLGKLLDQRRYDEVFGLIALCPVLGVLAWLVLTRRSLERPAMAIT